MKKVFELQDGSLFCGAGEYEEVLLVADWLNRGRKDMPDIKGFEGMIISTRGCEFLGSRLRPYSVAARYMSIGSGAEYANTAMECGKTASQAVAIAMKFDRHTGGQIHVFTPKKIVKKRKRTVH